MGVDFGYAIVPQPNYVTLRRRLNDRAAHINVGYFGGSVTRGAVAVESAKDSSSYVSETDCWRARVGQWLIDNHGPEDRITNIDLSLGATGSEAGAYRFGANITVPLDLLFIEFALNDLRAGAPTLLDPHARDSVYRALTSIVMQARENNPDMAIFICISGLPTGNELALVALENVRQVYLRFARSNSLPTMDFARDVGEEPVPGCYSLEEGSVHPTPCGHEYYASAILSQLSGLLDSGTYAFPNSVPYMPEGIEPYPRNPQTFSAEEIMNMAVVPPVGFFLDFIYENHAIYRGYGAFVQADSSLEVELEGITRFRIMSPLVYQNAVGDPAGTLDATIQLYINGTFFEEYVGGESWAPGMKLISRFIPVRYEFDPEQTYNIRIETTNVPLDPTWAIYLYAVDRLPE